MSKTLIVGKNGAGKGTLLDKFMEGKGDKYRIVAMSSLLTKVKETDPELWAKIDAIMKAGDLVPDSIILGIIEKELENETRSIVFDGFPRTIEQAKALTTLLADRNMKLNVVIGLEVNDEELTARLIKRGKDSGRSDDNEETIKKRLQVYHNQTSPLRDFYINEGLYAKIEGCGTIEEIFANIKSAVASAKK